MPVFARVPYMTGVFGRGPCESIAGASLKHDVVTRRGNGLEEIHRTRGSLWPRHHPLSWNTGLW